MIPDFDVFYPKYSMVSCQLEAHMIIRIHFIVMPQNHFKRDVDINMLFGSDKMKYIYYSFVFCEAASVSQFAYLVSN